MGEISPRGMREGISFTVVLVIVLDSLLNTPLDGLKDGRPAAESPTAQHRSARRTLWLSTASRPSQVCIRKAVTPPPPPGPPSRELDSERSDEEGASVGSESRTEKEGGAQDRDNRQDLHRSSCAGQGLPRLRHPNRSWSAFRTRRYSCSAEQIAYDARGIYGARR